VLINNFRIIFHLGAVIVISVRNIKGKNIYSSYLLPKRANNKIVNKIDEDKGVK